MTLTIRMTAGMNTITNTATNTSIRWSLIRGAIRPTKPLSHRAVRHAVKTLPATIYRAKGFVYLDETPDRKGIVHVVGQRRV